MLTKEITIEKNAEIKAILLNGSSLAYENITNPITPKINNEIKNRGANKIANETNTEKIDNGDFMNSPDFYASQY